ncbi:5-hydroxyisourate hydrolase-like protein (transthyretin family) [Microbacterium sp. BE35]|uniref:fibronectin type III domain-containing protein n=1 Tax=Microbacterium sp. BE35 TaxID=2817773 RepID=UPI002866C485|nr:fibronectin type III domain-containing protein [Microbacterium sp. BE35]MDR7189114.1 5-hydroxyisourate hydrolase-like protein (transthyretin family) [Microbacterium sp. BE35]
MSAASTASGIRKRTFLIFGLALALVIALAGPAVRPATADDGVRSVSGVVSLPAGAPVEWLGAVRVSAQPVSGLGYQSVSVDPVTGAYSLTDLAPGSYRIQFSVNQFWNGSGYTKPNLVGEYYGDTTDWNSATVLDVSAASASSIDAQLAVGRTISGRVTLPEGVDPASLSAISVNASSPTGGSGYTQIDPVTGEYTITGLPSGAYQVQFNVGTYWDGTASVKPNLVSEYYDTATDWSTATAVDVSTGDRSGIDATLRPGRSITGTVTLPAGAPTEWLSAITVSASAVNGSMIGGIGATPDPETGRYTITGLAPGSYQVAFRVMTSMPGTELPNLVDEYYDNAYTLSSATPVDVSGGDKAGIDATLESGHSISGTITLPADAPTEWMEAVSISVMTLSGEYFSNGLHAKVDAATGAYTYSGLPAGEFIVQFSASGYFDGTDWTSTDIASEYYDDSVSSAGATLVSTASGDATGIDADLQHGGGIDMDLDVSALLGTGDGIGISITDLDGNVLTSYGDPLPQDGHYPVSMSNLTPGDYRVAVTTSTWDEQTSTSTLTSAQFLRFATGTSVKVTPGDSVTGTVTARAADAGISGHLRAEGFTGSGDVLGSALVYENLDGSWVRIPEIHFDTTRNGNTSYALAIPDGTYTVGFETDYATTGVDTTEKWWNNKPTLAAADPIILVPGQHRTAIDGTIHPDGVDPDGVRSVSGVVSLPAGAPVEWLGAVRVSAQPVSGLGYQSVSVDPVTGAYSLTDLAPGSYRIQFSVNQFWNGSGYTKPNLVGEYYGDTTDWNSATVLDVSAASASSIDAQLAVGRTISGRVTLPEGVDPASLSAISVNASSPTGGSGYTQIDPVTGEYTITGLPSGAYQVQFNVGTYWDGTASVKPNLVSEYYDTATDWSTATAVDVSTGDRSGIDATLRPGRSITGTVTLPAGAPTEWLSAITVSASAVNGSMIGGIGATPDPETGRYTITGLAPGSYQVAFRVMTSMPGTELPNLVDEYYDNAYTLSSATPVDVSGGDKAGIDATLESGHSISGTITLPADAPTEWMEAVSISVMTLSGEYFSNGLHAKVDAATGAYTYSGLPAGEFIVQFSASGYFDGTDWTSTDIASEYYDDSVSSAGATLVSTASGDATGIDADLQHGGGIDMDLDVSALLGTGDGIGISITDLDGNVLTSYGDPLPQDGHYPVSMSNLTPGDYRVAVTTSTWDEQTSTSTLTSAQFLRFATGTSVKVTPGDSVTGTVTARAADAGISGHLRAEGFTGSGDVLGSALVYENLDGSWVRIPEIHFDTTRNGNTSYALAIPDGTYTVGFETDYATTGVDTTEKWWNNKPTLAAADPIILVPGQHRTAIDGTIHPRDDGPLPVAPTAPRLITAVAGNGSATVSWQAPESDGGETIASYTVRVFPSGAIKTTTGLSAVIGGLQAGTPYTFTVTATNAGNLTSPQSAPTAPVIPLRPITFTDTAGHVFQNEIAWMAQNGISRGWEVRPAVYEFRPQNQILRGEMAAFLYRLAGQPAFTAPSSSPFVDVPTGHVFYKEIAWLAGSGISRGWETPRGTEFRAEWATSREVMAAFLYRFQESPAYTPSGASPFRDVQPGTVFYKEILWLAAEGISTGWDVGSGCRDYRPGQNVLRSEMAAFIYRMQTGGTTPVDANTCRPPGG